LHGEPGWHAVTVWFCLCDGRERQQAVTITIVLLCPLV
jgi:hypothetical protein